MSSGPESLEPQITRKYNSIHAAFRAFDQDSNNYITIDNWINAFKKFNLTPQRQEIEALVASHADSQGRLSFRGFSALVGGKKTNSSPERAEREPQLDHHILCDLVRQKLSTKWSSLRAAFRALDFDKSGYIDQREFRSALAGSIECDEKLSRN